MGSATIYHNVGPIHILIVEYVPIRWVDLPKFVRARAWDKGISKPGHTIFSLFDV